MNRKFDRARDTGDARRGRSGKEERSHVAARSTRHPLSKSPTTTSSSRHRKRQLLHALWESHKHGRRANCGGTRRRGCGADLFVWDGSDHDHHHGAAQGGRPHRRSARCLWRAHTNFCRNGCRSLASRPPSSIPRSIRSMSEPFGRIRGSCTSSRRRILASGSSTCSAWPGLRNNTGSSA